MNHSLAVKWCQFAILGLVLTGLASAIPAVAAEGDRPLEKTSLGLVPADAAFYSVSLRNREQLEIITSSRAWAKLKNMQAVQMARQLIEAQLQPGGALNQPDGPLAQVMALMELPENQELLSVLKDMVSEEVFVYGDGQFEPFLDLVSQVMGVGRLSPNIEKLKGETDLDDEALQARAMLDALQANLDQLKLPNMVFGFRVSDGEPAERQLKRLEILTGFALSQFEGWPERLTRERVGDVDALVFRLDGSLVPWNEIEWEKVELEEGEYDDLKQRLMEVELIISLAVRGDYMLLSIGGDTSHLTELGADKGLISRKELAPVVAAGDQRIIGIGFTSALVHKKLSTNDEDIDDLVALARQMLPVTELPEDLQERIVKDAAALGEDLKKIIPEYGAVTTYSMLTPRGTESFTYDWSENLGFDASKPLTLLQHVGTSPLLAAVVRSKNDPRQWDTFVKWLHTGFQYAEEFGKPQLEEGQQAIYEDLKKKLLPLAHRFHATTQQKLMPALADGQIGLVLDNEWKISLPEGLDAETQEALGPLLKNDRVRMFELAFVTGVSDAKLLVEAMGEYRIQLNETIEVVRSIEGVELPEFEIPAPQSDTVDGSTLYWYALPFDGSTLYLGSENGVKLDGQFQPTFGVAKTAASVALTPGHARRLLSQSKPQFGGVLKDLNKSRALAVYFDWAGLVNSVAPVVEYVVQHAYEQAGGPEEMNEMVFSGIRTGFELLTVLQQVTSETYIEGDTIITHSETHWRDVE